MQTLSVIIDSIEIGERHRALSENAVISLAESVKQIGLKQPISIRVVDLMVVDGQECEGVPVLVAGRHRLEAAKRLGWSHIDCFEVSDDAIQAEIWEIAENLHRADLSKEQRDEHIRRYAELIEAAARIVPQNAEQVTPKRGRPESTVTKIAKATGVSDDIVRRALKPSPRKRPTPAGRQMEKLRRAWREASPIIRAHFLEEITRKAAA